MCLGVLYMTFDLFVMCFYVSYMHVDVLNTILRCTLCVLCEFLYTFIGFRVPGSTGSGILDPGSWNLDGDQGSWIQDQNPGSWTKLVRSWTEVCTKLVRSWNEVEPKLVRSWYEVGTRLVRSWTPWYQVGTKLDPLGTKLGRSWYEIQAPS